MSVAHLPSASGQGFGFNQDIEYTERADARFLGRGGGAWGGGGHMYLDINKRSKETKTRWSFHTNAT